MNQIDSSARRWWQGWFSDWSLCGPDGRNVGRAFAWTAAFGVLLVAGGLFIAGRLLGEAEAADAIQIVFTVSLFTFCFGLQYRLRKFNA